jgi:hypothetical protein
MSYEPYFKTAMTIPLPSTLVVGTNTSRVPLDGPGTVTMFGGYLNGLTLGTFIVTLTNDAGTVLATLTWTATGVQKTNTIASPNLAATDSLHVNVTGIGVGQSGCTVVIWLKMPALA